ncbi:MAG: accessory gene regulator B family protein [Lachnospiraceae bacterium]|nr:accessory gene regulator B family protein [Lachnospiraceae bacterium]
MPTMEQIADKLTVLYLKILPEQKNDYEIIKYGNENIISSVCNYLVVLGSGTMCKDIMGAFVFYFTFTIIRSRMGGYHANTYLRCNVLIFLNVFAVLKLASLPVRNIIKPAEIAVFIITTVEIVLAAPIINPNKLIKVFSRKKVKLQCFIILIAIEAIAKMLYLNGANKASIIMLFSLLSNDVAFVAGLIKNIFLPFVTEKRPFVPNLLTKEDYGGTLQEKIKEELGYEVKEDFSKFGS